MKIISCFKKHKRYIKESMGYQLSKIYKEIHRDIDATMGSTHRFDTHHFDMYVWLTDFDPLYSILFLAHLDLDLWETLNDLYGKWLRRGIIHPDTPFEAMFDWEFLTDVSHDPSTNSTKIDEIIFLMDEIEKIYIDIWENMMPILEDILHPADYRLVVNYLLDVEDWILYPIRK